MSKILFFIFIACTAASRCVSAGKASHCVYGITVKELLKLAGISGRNLVSYVAKLKRHNVDETILGTLSLKQLNTIGITTLGDRLKIHKFFANDGNDCTSSSCQNNGICHDGFRCFSCRCDPTGRYYGPSCGQLCPCRNGGRCKTTRTGFECHCPPGYSGELCGTKYLTEDRFLNLEKNVAQIAARLNRAEKQVEQQKKKIEDLENRHGNWQLHRANKILNQLERIELHQKTPTYNQKIPVVLPKGTRAILISVYCNFWNSDGHAYLNYIAHQKGNDKPEAKVYGYNTHFRVYANTFYYEQMMPWNTSLPNEIVFKVTSSYQTGGKNNWYRVRLVGYVTTH